MTTNIVNSLVDLIVANRDPNARAGCASSLGSIHSQLGGMAAGLHLQKIHGILMSLCRDASPVVHFAASEALSNVVDSAGLAFSGYVSSTLGLVSYLWTSDSHNESSSSLNTSNAESDYPTLSMVAYLIGSLVNVLGPDLQHSTKVRDLILKLNKHFVKDCRNSVNLESLQILKHISLYDSKHVDLHAYLSQLQSVLASPYPQHRQIAVDGIQNLAQRDAASIFRASGRDLEDKLWNALNDDPAQEGVRNTFRAWLTQTALTEPGPWIFRLQKVLTAVTSHEPELKMPITNEENSTAEIQDEEVAGFAVSEAQQQRTTTASTTTQGLLRWQVRDFALECLSELVAAVGRDLAADIGSEAGQVLQQRISEVIRLAFLASTASVVELRVKGMRLIDQVLSIFGSTPDPDFAEALLLEQYQAQISSALTPAFGADSSPELAAAAIKVCATFIATGLVTDVDRMGRILKTLVNALHSFATEPQTIVIGDLKGLSTNAEIMVRMSILTAWAELQVASTEHDYLIKVVKPHLQKLIPSWLSSLQEFARLRFEPDISSSMGPVTMDEGVEIVYASLNRQTLLRFYQESWLKLVDAIASLIEQDSNFVFQALDGNLHSIPANGDRQQSTNINYRDQPSAFFFVLFGIAIEALVTQSSSSETSTLNILLALKKILRPSVSGNAMFREAVFTESIDIFGRLALTEDLQIQSVIVDIVRNLCIHHPSAVSQGKDHDENLSDDVEQLFELARIIVLVLARIIPNLSNQPTSSSQNLDLDEAISLIQSSLNALVDASAIFPSIIKKDLHACIFHIFATILGTATLHASAAPQSLPIFKRFLHGIATEHTDISDEEEVGNQLLGCLARFLSILSNAQRRESEASLPCVKNTLLALTIFLTTISHSLSSTSPLITKVLDEMLDCLGDVGLAKVSAGCLRSLLLTPFPKSETDDAIALYLLPHLLHFVTDAQQPDPEAVRPIITQALVSLATTFPSSEPLAQASTYYLILPAILQRATNEGAAADKELAARILELASANQALFRGAVKKLKPEQRTHIERAIRESGIGAEEGGKARGGKSADRDGGGGEPSIALKFSFGGAGA